MAPASTEEQFQFLISCIRYSNNGKVDFVKVANECSIISKGAAAKRYERMMRAHGIVSSSPSSKTGTAKTKTERSDSKSAASKKRKMMEYDGENHGAGVDDDEGLGETNNSSKTFKAEAEESETFKVGEDQTHSYNNQFGMDGTAELMQFYDGHGQLYSRSGMGEQDYKDSKYDGSMGGFSTPCPDPENMMYGMPVYQPQDMGFAYSHLSPAPAQVSPTMFQPIPRQMHQNFRYQSQQMLQYPAEKQGNQESPVLVD